MSTRPHAPSADGTLRSPAAQQTISQCSKRFDEIAAEVEADTEGTNTVLGNTLCEIIRDALNLETPTTAEELVDLLTRIARSTFNPTALGLVLNNLGCVEKRRGNFKVALHHLKRAADEEGGIVSASPTTLLNISAVYSALQMYAEAASVSNHAVTRCETDIQSVSPAVHAAALYNLAAALEGSGELEHAERAYKKAQQVLEKNGVPRDHPQFRSTLKAQEQLEIRLRNHRGNKSREEWANSTLPSIIKKAADKSINQGGDASLSLNNTPSRRLNPLEKRGMRKSQTHSEAETENRSASIPRSGLEHDLALGLLSSSGQKTTRSQNLSQIATVNHRPLGIQYHSTVRDFHVFPVNSRAANKKHKPLENPTWDMNPLPFSPSVQRSLGKDPAVDRSVSMSYIPHHLVPFVADLKYKEHTRRTMIITDYMTRLLNFRLERDRCECLIAEGEARVDTEIDELRSRKVLQQWFKGKVVFVTHYAVVETEERKERHQMHRQLADYAAAMMPRARLLQLQVEEEGLRKTLTKQQEAAERNELKIWEETQRIRLLSAQESETPKEGIAHALALWCLEGAVDPQSALKLADSAYLQSHYVQSRHLWFGKPFGYSKQVRTSGGDGSPSPFASAVVDDDDEDF